MHFSGLSCCRSHPEIQRCARSVWRLRTGIPPGPEIHEEDGSDLRLVIFVLVAVILVFAKSNADGFNILWRYFAWSNQSLSLFAFLAITVWMFETGRSKICLDAAHPGRMVYVRITVTYIANAQIGFNIPWLGAYIIGVVAAAAYVVLLIWYGKKRSAIKAGQMTGNK